MEKRALIAIVLSVGILLGWQALFAPAPPPASPPSAPGAPGPSAPVPGTESTAAPGPVTGVPVPRTSPEPSPGGGGAEVVGPLYRIRFAPDGSVTAWTIEYRGPKPVVVGGALRPLTVAVRRPSQAPEIVPLRPETPSLTLDGAQPTGRLAFSGTTADGVRIRKTLLFASDTYRVGVELQAEAPAGRTPEPIELELYWTTPVAEPGRKPGDPWLTFGEGANRQQLLGRLLVGRAGEMPAAFEAPAPALAEAKGAVPELKDPHLVPAAVVKEAPWGALENDFFIAALVPPTGSGLLRERAQDLAATAIVFRAVQPAPARPWQGAATVYVGPKEWTGLQALGVGLEAAQARNYGYLFWFVSWGTPPFPFPWMPMAWFCVPLLWLMNFFGTRLPGHNYGVAIILLTVLIKVLFYPLSHKSMRSMKKMQALQPQINALRSKHRADPQRVQREQMELFRKHRVNPVGGCLPMVVQIPIFYALYLTLQYSVELQGAPFVLWITDLSRKDPYYVLPILMGISMLIQQKMTPTVGDPRQAKIMLIMPVIFTFMFLEFPTGLVLYWFVNNVLTIAQQYLIDRSTARSAAAEAA